MRRRLLAFGLVALVATGCGSMKPQDFAEGTPTFVLEEYFAGKTRAWGVFEDRFGDVRRQFVVDITGVWDGKELVLDEDFTYSDGEVDERIWRIVKIDAHRYEGRADDVVGVAAGTAYGNALNWRYELDLKVGDSTRRVRFDDWMFLQPDGILINRASVTKWGFDVGEVTVVFGKIHAGEAAANGGDGRTDPNR